MNSLLLCYSLQRAYLSKIVNLMEMENPGRQIVGGDCYVLPWSQSGHSSALHFQHGNVSMSLHD